MKRRTISIRFQLLSAALLVLIPITLVFALFVVRAVEEMNAQIAEANASTLRGYRSSVESQVLQIDSFLYSLYGEPQWEEEWLREEIRSEAGRSETVAMIALFQDGEYWTGEFSTGYSAAEEEREGLRELACSWEREGRNREGWFLTQEEGGAYFLRTVQKSGIEVMCVIDLAALARKAQTEFALESPVVFVDNKGNSLTTAVWAERVFGKKIPEFSGYLLAGSEPQYMIVSESLLGMKVLYGVRYQAGTGVLKWLRLGPVLFFGAMAALLVLALIYIGNSVLRPLSTLAETMRQIQAGDFKRRTGGYISREFEQVNDTFNSMIDTITNLKIESYERKLEAQRAEMTALRMQIQPHFYLNCLKNIYGLSQLKDFQKIQSLIILLSRHLRYLFSMDREEVPLREELKMCENYMQIQAEIRGDGTSCILNVEPALLELSVPPVSVLSLVENCAKYGISPDTSLRVKIEGKAFPMEEGQLVSIAVSDNGPGFPSELLEQLNRDEKVSGYGEHVGLQNLIQRFRLLYGPAFAVNFWNDRGAFVEILIQQKAEE